MKSVQVLVVCENVLNMPERLKNIVDLKIPLPPRSRSIEVELDYRKPTYMHFSRTPYFIPHRLSCPGGPWKEGMPGGKPCPGGGMPGMPGKFGGGPPP